MRELRTKVKVRLVSRHEQLNSTDDCGRPRTKVTTSGHSASEESRRNAVTLLSAGVNVTEHAQFAPTFNVNAVFA